MQAFPINYMAVAVAALVRMVIGALWYSPLLFGRQWADVARLSLEQVKEGMGKSIAVDLVGSFIMAFVLAHAVHYAGAAAATQGATVGFFNWLGFVAVVTLGATMYEHRPTKLFIINNGFQLTSLLAMGAILAVWV